MPREVFISYSAKDKAVAFETCAALEARDIKCWIAPRNVKPGKEWGESIVDAITESRIMVLIFSAHANASSQVRREVERAANNNTIIIPFRIEDIAPVKSLEFFLSSIHWLDAFPTPSEEHFKNLADSISESLPEEVIQKPGRSPIATRLTPSEPLTDASLADDEREAENSPPERTSSAALKRPLPLMLIGAGILVLVIFGLLYLLRSKNKAEAGQTKTDNSPDSNIAVNQNTDNSNKPDQNPPSNKTVTDGESLNYQGAMPTTSYSVPANPRSIDKIIILDTATIDMLATMNFLTSGSRQVSYHYVIDKKGDSYSLVGEQNIAFHTPALSKTSIAIGLIHMPNELYPEPQRRRLIRLLANISLRYKIAAYNILTKQEVDPDMKITDLTPEMVKLRKEVREEASAQFRKKQEAERAGATESP